MFLPLVRQIEPRTSSQRQLRRRARRARALSLIEVLMSVFVVSIGLLGVAALLPVAQHDAQQGTLNDLSTLVGKHAWRDMTVRGWNNPLNWFFVDGSPVYVVNDPNRWQTAQKPPILVLDPRFVAFPTGTAIFPANASPTDPNFPRITLENDDLDPITPPVTITDVVADEMFTSPDDLAFAEAEQADAFPAQMYTYSDPNDPAPSRKRQSQGRFSWMTTLVPDAANPELYRASIVVFHQRSLTDPELVFDVEPLRLEQMIDAGNSTNQLKLGMSWTGIDVVLKSAAATDLDVSVGDWLALVKADPTDTDLRWFRVSRTAAEPELDGGSYKLEVSLTGADTDLDNWFPMSNGHKAFAIYAKNVQAVYEKTIRLDFSE